MNTDKILAEKIASEYAPKETSKIVALKKLDKKAKEGATIFAFTFGIIMSLVMGAGMSFCMGVIGNGTITSFVIGLVLGIVGILGVSINYPLYTKMLKAGKLKYGNDIIRLAKEISEEE